MRFRIGDEIAGRTIIDYDGRFYYVRCPLCQRETYGSLEKLLKRCSCNRVQEHKDKGRYSGLEYENSEEKLKALKEKYKNGVPPGTVEEFVMNL